jgi:hypothetical protein
MGSAFFDIEPYFPCSALFIDPANCLLLKRHGKFPESYTRIGLGTFMRTMRQRSVRLTTGGYTVFGPVTMNDPRQFITIF